MMDETVDWRGSHRVRLHHYANGASDGDVDITVPRIEKHNQVVGVKENMSGEAAANFFLDVKLAGKPIQCDERDGTCTDMRLVEAMQSINDRFDTQA